MICIGLFVDKARGSRAKVIKEYIGLKRENIVIRVGLKPQKKILFLPTVSQKMKRVMIVLMLTCTI